MEGYVGRIYEREEWHKALTSLLVEGASSELDPQYLHDELEVAAESVLLLLDTEEEAKEASSQTSPNKPPEAS